MKQLLVLALILAAAAPASASRSDVWRTLHRPLHLPHIAAGASCPVTSRKQDFGRWGIGVGFGQGPAAPVGINEAGRPVLRYHDPIPPQSPFYGSRWFGNKVLWAVKPTYGGPVLVRGRQLDGPNELRFEGGIAPAREIRIRPGGTPITNRPSFTRVRAPGCYGYQVDGLRFSYVIVFEAKPVGI